MHSFPFSTRAAIALGHVTGLIAALFLLSSAVAAPTKPLVKPADELVLIGGMNNIRHHDDQPFGAVQLRSARDVCGLHPYLNAGVAGHGSHYAGVGMSHTFDLPRTIKISVGTGPGWYRHEANDPDLGYAIEFSSWIEFSAEVMGRRIGLSVAHLSNAHLGRSNPGTEAIGLNIHWRRW